MSSDFPLIREFVKRALADTTKATTPNAAQIVSAFDTLCERLRGRLEPLFGRPATHALYARALHLASGEFQWVPKLIPNAAEQCSAGGLEALTTSVALDDLREGLAAVLAHDIALLSELVGSDLIVPLVEQAWGVAATPGSAPESSGTNG
jgi:hypothetical protein